MAVAAATLVILWVNAPTNLAATVAVTPQGQLLRSDGQYAQLLDQDAAARKVISESSQVNAQAYVSALRRENRPKALAIAAVVVLIPVLLALMCVALAVKVGRRLIRLAWPAVPAEEEASPAALPRVTLGGTTLQLKEEVRGFNQEPALEMLMLAVLLLALALGLYSCVAWLALVPGPFVQQFSCADTAASSDVSPMVRETLGSFCWSGHRWEGVTRREAELLLSGLERSLAMSPGAVLEFGVGLGETTLWVSRFLDVYAQVSGEPRRPHHVYDPFQGPDFPKRDRVVCGGSPCTQTWQAWPGHALQGLLRSRRWLFHFFLWSQGAQMPEVHQGYMVQIPSDALPERVAFALVDADNYAGTILPLRLAYSRLGAHGEIFVHAYRQQSCPGVQEAVDRFFQLQRSQGVYKWAGSQSQGVSWAVGGPQLAYNISHARMAKLGWKWSSA